MQGTIGDEASVTIGQIISDDDDNDVVTDNEQSHHDSLHISCKTIIKKLQLSYLDRC